MSKNLAKQDLAGLSEEINFLHDKAIVTAQDAVDHARQCGELLIEAKKQVPHGEFTEWLNANCVVAPRQARRYMQLARDWDAIESKRTRESVLSINESLRLLQPDDDDSPETEDTEEDSTPDTSLDATGEPFEVTEESVMDDGVGEDGRMDSDGQDDQQEPPPGRSGETKEAPVRHSSPTSPPKDQFKTQQSKTVKTAEALMRAFDDLNDLHTHSEHAEAIRTCKVLIALARQWR